MACTAKGNCGFAYRKGGNAVHCQIQTRQGGKWDFCKYQYLCRHSGRYELSKDATTCTLNDETAKKAAERLEEAITETKEAIPELFQPKLEIPKTGKKQKAVKKDNGNS